ncbi:MAG: FeS cluster assembly protein SufD [Alphaproteobacteria bacterium MarineAlpha3_Bin5]|nr:MAG: FeS cluster assembly protein SufD [Alphaproteobacteria bacterium MarineAlpha3_Bin5]
MSMISALPFIVDLDKESLPGKNLEWLSQRRLSALDSFLELGLPTRNWEDWKYTRLQPLENTTYRRAVHSDSTYNIDNTLPIFSVSSGPRLVFVEGIFRPDLSKLDGLPDTVTLLPLSEVLRKNPNFLKDAMAPDLERKKPMFVLTEALMDSGFVFHARENLETELLIEIVHIGGGAKEPVALFPRNLIIIEDNAKITLIEYFKGNGRGTYLANALTDVKLGKEATLKHYKIQEEIVSGALISSSRVFLQERANYESFKLGLGALLSRDESYVQLLGEGAHCELRGAFINRGSQHHDITTCVEHSVPGTKLTELFKGVLEDEARGVFQGKIIVKEGAQKTDAEMTTKTLLLSEGAEINAKPELEIYADDVKCSHGAASGQLDEAGIFYLRSRGIPEPLAKNLLVQSFIQEAIDGVTENSVKTAIMDRVLHALPGNCYLAHEWRDEQ